MLAIVAVVAPHFSLTLTAFNDRLVKAGKPKKLALTAVRRKLVVLLDQLLKILILSSPERPLLTP